MNPKPISSNARNDPKTGAIIVNWRSGECLARCLNALSGQDIPFSRIIVVDNDGSGLPDVGAARRTADIQYIRMNHNSGFAKANNVALEYLEDCEWVALVNPDAFLSPSWLGNMLAAARKYSEFSFFASRLVMAGCPSVLDGIGDVYHASGLVWRSGHGDDDAKTAMAGREVFSPCAAAAMYRRRDVVAAGGFDEDFFCYVEDVDLGFRLRLAGHRCRLVPDAIAHHVGSATTGGRGSDTAVYFGHRNLVWAFVKNVPGMIFWALLPVHGIMTLMAIAVFAGRGQLRVILRSKRDAVIGLPKMWKKRSIIQSRRNVSALAIWGMIDKQWIPASAPWRRSRACSRTRSV